jgi:cytochrome c-type biogenesis protein CcmF
MNQLGYYFLLLALSAAIYGTVTSVLGARRNREDLVRTGERGALSVTVLLSLAIIILLHALVTRNFQNEYVAQYSNRALPIGYTITALWGGQKGSLLFWGWLLSAYSGIVIYINRKRNRELMPYVTAVLLVVNAFFIFLNLVLANPFKTLPFRPEDGQGLNPILQHPAMAIHPPMLYLGFVGFAVPFAFAIAALLIGGKALRPDAQTGWLVIVRRWTLVPWLFLGTGLILGARWAYVELGWGGYWGWDPVENAGFMPWLTATAFFHSIMIQERKPMLRIWNMVLILLTFILSIFGTFITRSGIISSVHTFTESSIGPFFLTFIFATILFSANALSMRWKDLRSQEHLDSFTSREAGFLFNNLLLLTAAFAVFWGTIFPIISEAVRGVKITVGPPFFNQVLIPLGLILYLLTGVGPLLAWRRSSGKVLRKHFTFPLLAALLGGGILYFLGIVQHHYALISFALTFFVTATIISEFSRGARARRHATGENIIKSLFKITLKNKRRYGGYVVHLAVVFLFVGFTGSAFNQKVEGAILPGDSLQLGKYNLEYEKAYRSKDANKMAVGARLTIQKDGKEIGRLVPQRYFYARQEQNTTEVALMSTLKEDLYLVLANLTEDDEATVQAYLNPLVSFLWIGGIINILGTILAILPTKRERKRTGQLSSVDKKLKVKMAEEEKDRELSKV